VNKTDSNRLNAQNSTGPGDTTLTRFNAVKHGLLAKGITELDDSDAYESLVQRLHLPTILSGTWKFSGCEELPSA
jgi:hypothetical protein